VLFNAAAERMLACPADEAIGASIDRFIPQRFRAEHSRHVRRYGESGVTNRNSSTLGMLWGLRSTGEEVPIEAAISKVEVGGTKFFAVVIRDVTERLKAEETVRESEERFRLVADTAPVLIWMSGTDKLCTYFNKPWLEFTGRSLKQELGNGWAEGVHPEDLQRCLETYTQSFDRREKFTMEYRLRYHDGEYRWILDVGVPRFNQDRSFAGYIGIGVDVTERKRIEQERLLSETRFRQFFETMPEYCYMVSPNGEIIDTNSAACAALGYTKDELMGKPLSALYAPECVPKMRELFKKWKADGGLRNEEMIVITKQGERRTVLLNAGSVRDSNGNILHSTSVHVDITERKLAEETLFRHAAIVDSSDDAIVGADLNGTVTDWNKGAERLFGYSASEAIGKHLSFLAPTDHPEDGQDILRKVINGEAVKHYETVRRKKDGTCVDISLTVSPVVDAASRVIRVSGIARDFTERKTAERRLRESEEQFRTLAEAIPQLCWMAHGDGHIFWYNQRWFKYTGTTPEQMEGWGWQSVHDLHTLPYVLERWKASIATGEPFDMVFPLRAADGVFHPFLTRIMPIKDGDGRVVRWFGTNTDITELRDAQRKLIEAQEQERARIGRELHDDITQRLAMLALKLQELQDNPSEFHGRVQELSEETTEISNDVQALSHEMHASKLEYLGVVAGFRSWCEEFGERQKMEIDLRVNVRSPLPLDLGLCLFRVLQEALHNAAKHSGVRRIEVQLREGAGEIYLIVGDSGKGFNVEAAMQDGGLGLTSMQERVRLVNGTISIESKPMAGTTVHVRVPFVSEHDSRRAAG
jgi:PAS domain S-box-containing protein